MILLLIYYRLIDKNNKNKTQKKFRNSKKYLKSKNKKTRKIDGGVKLADIAKLSALLGTVSYASGFSFGRPTSGNSLVGPRTSSSGSDSIPQTASGNGSGKLPPIDFNRIIASLYDDKSEDNNDKHEWVTLDDEVVKTAEEAGQQFQGFNPRNPIDIMSKFSSFGDKSLFSQFMEEISPILNSVTLKPEEQRQTIENIYNAKYKTTIENDITSPYFGRTVW